jgi:hypothetical protein
MDILYYSNHCKHSQKVVQFIAKNNLIDKISCICVDRRVRDTNNNQLYIVLENGKRVIMPPNVHSVPALLQVKKNYSVVLGEKIIEYFQTTFLGGGGARVGDIKYNANANEPIGYNLFGITQNSNIVSEPYTNYNMTPTELSSKGRSEKRLMYNYVPATHKTIYIQTPPDTYRPDKVSQDITIDKLQQQRNQEVPVNTADDSPPQLTI